MGSFPRHRAAGRRPDRGPPQPGATLLDLGSGCGGSARALAERFGCRVVALNLSEEHNRRHRAANARRGLDGLIEVVTGSLNHLPYEAERFGFVSRARCRRSH
ncbi:SAM-dependent methyltransferase [Streptomyces capitiformicae]|uniref:SAM-dependent methyltransferase n=1 Tax=Streptomyces capitiformicae TaxID=2014920 RepID=UPI001E39A2E7|nr:methyltransferase domain-containing protein [Streptomyces capitiformicae]